MTEKTGPDPGATGGQTGPHDDETDDFAAEVIAAAEAIVANGPTIESHPELVDNRTEHQRQAEANLNGIWQTADAMAQAAVPQSRLMFSGVTVHDRMRRTVDYYQGPRGEPQIFMADFRPGTQNRVVYPCQITQVRPVKGSSGDYEIVFMNPSVFDDKRRPIPCVMRIATELPRARAAGEPHLPKYKQRTELHVLATDGTWHGMLTDKERKRDLELVESRDALMQYGAQPPYRAGALNVGQIGDTITDPRAG
jgi:hypothetical protein